MLKGYRNLAIVLVFVFLMIFKLNFIFFNPFTFHSSVQKVVEPYAEVLLTKAIPGLNLLDENETLFASPVSIMESFFMFIYSIDSQDPTSYFNVTFTPMRQSHPEVMAWMDDDKQKKDNSYPEKSDYHQEREHKDVATEIDETMEEESMDFDELTSIDKEEMSEPKALIYHSHTTESFVPTSGNAFSEDKEKSIVEVGKNLKDKLETEGIKTIHDKTVHDLPTRHESYVRSLKTVEEILEENPQIEMVIDLHRDGVRREMTTAQIDGNSYGKILFLVGSRDNHPDWKENYKFANYIKSGLEEIKPELSRGVKTRRFSYNQEVHPRSVLIEVGGHKNSIEEVKRSIPYLSKSLIKTYLKITEDE